MSEAAASRPRRTRLLVLALLALLAAAVAVGAVLRAGAAACEAVQSTPEQGSGHLLGDAEPPEEYVTTPPTSGWHVHGVGHDRLGVHPDDPLTEPEQVSVLEIGGVVITYRGLDAADERRLVELARGPLEGRVALTPYEAVEPGEVALAAWTTLQRCDGVDAEAITEFVDAHARPSAS